MQVQEKKIKGFNLLELVVVVVIIGIISAVAYPNFSSWSKERKTRLADAEKIKEEMFKEKKDELFYFIELYSVSWFLLMNTYEHFLVQIEHQRVDHLIVNKELTNQENELHMTAINCNFNDPNLETCQHKIN